MLRFLSYLLPSTALVAFFSGLLGLLLFCVQNLVAVLGDLLGHSVHQL